MPAESDPFTGPDRRSPDVWRIAMDGRVDRIEGEIRGVAKDVRCVVKTWETFQEEFGPILRESLESKARREKLRAAATEKLVTGGIWATLIFLGLAAWEWLQNHIGKPGG